MEGEGERREDAEDDEGDFSEYGRHLRDKYGEPGVKEEAASEQPEKEPLEASAFRSYVKELREKYGIDADEQAERVENLQAGSGAQGSELQNGHSEIDSDAGAMPPIDDGSEDNRTDAVATAKSIEGSERKVSEEATEGAQEQTRDDTAKEAVAAKTSEEENERIAEGRSENHADSTVRAETGTNPTTSEETVERNGNAGSGEPSLQALTSEGDGRKSPRQGDDAGRPGSETIAKSQSGSGYADAREGASIPTDEATTKRGPTELAGRSSSSARGDGRVESAQNASGEEGARPPLAEIPIKASRLESPGGSYLRFDVHTSTIERESGFEFRQGKVYEVEWELEGIGRFTKEYRGNSDHFVFCTPVGVGDKMDLSDRYRIAIHSIGETHEVHLSNDGVHPRITASMSALRAAGLRGGASGDVLRLSFANLSRSRVPTEAFATIKGNHVAIPLTRMGVGVHDRVELSSASKYLKQDFVSDFNKHLPATLLNLRLSYEDRPSLLVDGASLRLRPTELRTHSSRVLLESSIERIEQNQRLFIDGRERTPTDCTLSLWYSGVERQSRVTCKVGKHMFAPYKLSSRPELVEAPAKVDKGFLKDKIELVSREGVEGKYRFRLDREAAETIDHRLGWAKRNGRFSYEKGGVAEDLCASVLEDAGWEEVRRHPLSLRASFMASNEHGPDSLMRLLQTSEYSFHEMKWWGEVGAAKSTARNQLGLGKQTWRSNDGPAVVGAYIDLVDMKPNGLDGTIHVERAW